MIPRRIYYTILLVCLTSLHSYSQIALTDNSFLSQNFIVSLEGGISYGFSDYKNSSLGGAIHGSIEYYPIIIQDGRLGLKLFGGGQQLNFSDSRKSISSLGESRNIESPIYTDIIQLGLGLTFGYALSENIIPTLTIGTTYLNFSPKNSAGHSLVFNYSEKYNKEIFSFAIEGNLKVKISERLSFNSVVGYYPVSSDYLDDIAAARNKDTYLSALIGISFALSGNFDSDNDGILDDQDTCPEEKEDVDNFDDYDGCPDLDNDKDGVIDTNDKCLNASEDVDGFEDYDGCPDPDNDKDGILDVNDKCLDAAEDFDRFEDEDGCPDNDNDKDGIDDAKDSCPNEAETKNNFQDEDGCPDVAPNQEMIYQFNLRGEDLFINISSDIKEAAKLILNEIAFHIQNNPGSKWRIEGHMDNQASVYSIKKSSYDRAKSVYDYLIKFGVSQNQLEVYGLGDSFPIGDNNTFEGRNANRRIMIIRED